MRRRRPRVTFVGDIGGVRTLHVGDEAMFAADLELVRRLVPRARYVAVSADPGTTSSWYRVAAVPRLSTVELRALGAARDADLLFITGGGNLNAAFPMMIHEYLAMARATAGSGGTIVVSGQTIGPALAPGDAERVGELLDLASFVGVRDPTSRDVALKLGLDPTKLVEQLDDAWRLEGTLPTGTGIDLNRPFIAVTIHPDALVVSPQAIRALGDELVQVAEHASAPIVLLPHCRAPEGPGGTNDEDVGAALAAHLQSQGSVAYSLSVLPPNEVIGLTRAASLVISSRYHPLVFATSASVPALGLWSGAYVRAKQRGALEPAGTEAWMLELEAAIHGALAPAAIEAWDRREELTSWLGRARPSMAERACWHERLIGEHLRATGIVARVPDEPGPAPAFPAAGAGPAPRGRWYMFSRAAPSVQPVPDPVFVELAGVSGHARAIEVERDELRSRLHARCNQRSPVPRSARATTVLDRIRLEVDADRIALVARVTAPGVEETDVRLRVYAPELMAGVDASATPFLPVMTFLAGRLGTDLAIEAPVDGVALDNATRAAATLADWWGWRRPAMAAATTMPSRARSVGTGLWFSRGVDSMYTLHRALAGELVEDDRPVELTHLLGLDWIDLPHAGSSMPVVWSETVAAAASLGVPLIRFSTDVRKVVDPFVRWQHYYGAVFSGLGLLMGSLLGTVLLSSSELGPDPRPYGGHPALDPLWSASTTGVVAVGSERRRCDKVATIASDDWALTRLKTCWEADTARNCGRCVKCLATMTALHIVGALDRCDRFDAELSPGAVRRAARLVIPDTRAVVADVLAHLSDDDLELRDAWLEYQERMTEQLDPADL